MFFRHVPRMPMRRSGSGPDLRMKSHSFHVCCFSVLCFEAGTAVHAGMKVSRYSPVRGTRKSGQQLPAKTRIQQLHHDRIYTRKH